MHTVSFIEENGDKKTFQVAENKVIFEALEDQGFELPHGCLSGSCSVCKCEVLEGAGNLSEPSSIEADTLKSVYKNKPHAEGKTIRLTCRAKVSGDITLKHFK